MAINDEDAAHEKLMSVAPHVMVLAHRIVEAYVPMEKQSMQQTEELYGLIDATIAKWAKRSNAGQHAKTLERSPSRAWTDWFKLRLEGSASPAKPTI